MSEIKVANQMMEEMSRKSDSEASYRKMTEIKCKAGETALLDAKERISTLEHQIREKEEHALLQSTKIKDLENYIDATRHQINKINANAHSKSKEANDMEMHLEHAETQKRKLELQYERSLTEIESSKKHSVDLTTMIIEKVSLLEFRFAEFFFFCRQLILTEIHPIFSATEQRN
jgi:septal ring factor EnvC (AmiA/AmiB activator)